MDPAALQILTPYIPYLISIIAILVVLEQLSYLKKKQFLPGPKLVFPLVGNAIPLITNTAKFWNKQSSHAKSTPLGLSANYILGYYILYIYSTNLSHKVFANVRPDAFHLVIHPFGKKLFDERNIIYMFGEDLNNIRRHITPNLNFKALTTYTNIQQRIIIKHLVSWCKQSQDKSIPLRFPCRDMNLETSQTVFLGPYLDEQGRKRFNLDYNTFNVGLMNVPIDLPGFAFRKARSAVQRLVETLDSCAEKSEKRMKAGYEPTCVIDFWMLENLKEVSEKSIEHDHRETGRHLFDLLFAAQDALTSSLLWSVVFLDSHPHVLEKVREEVARHWNHENSDLIATEQLREMKYTEAVAREVVRIRAPATMVPHVAAADFPLTENYVIPRGTLVFPSVYDSCFQGFTEPDRFDPDRFVERQEDRVYKKNFLAFGSGAHRCLGQNYAINYMVLFIAIFATLADFERDRTDGCDEFAYVPTIIPKDECRVFLSLRCTRFPL